MEAAFGRLHNKRAGAFGARPTVVESVMVHGEIGGSIYGPIYPIISVGWQLTGPKFELLLKKQIRHETGPEQRLRTEN